MKWILPVLMLLIVIPGLHYTGLISFFNTESDSDKNTAVSIPVPNWQAQNLKGEAFSLNQLEGQIVLLNFWASWCMPCYEEFPELIKTVQWAEGNIQLVAVSVDSEKKEIENFLRKIKKEQGAWNSKNIHIIWDPKHEIAKQFHVIKFPETFVLNRELKIVKKYTGIFSLESAKAFLSKVFGQNHRTPPK